MEVAEVDGVVNFIQYAKWSSLLTWKTLLIFRYVRCFNLDLKIFLSCGLKYLRKECFTVLGHWHFLFCFYLTSFEQLSWWNPSVTVETEKGMLWIDHLTCLENWYFYDSCLNLQILHICLAHTWIQQHLIDQIVADKLTDPFCL